jgi:nitroreductase
MEICPAGTLGIANGKASVTGNRCIACGHCEAVCPAGAARVGGLEEFVLQTIPVLNSWLPPGEYDTPRLVQLMRSRRSCRKYRNKPLSKELLHDLVTVGITAPSGTNSQKWTFTMLAERRHVETLGDSIAAFFRKLNRMARKPLFRLYSKLFRGDALGCYYRRHYASVRENIRSWEERREDHLFHGAPALIIVGSLPDASCPLEDAVLATQNILLAAHAIGLGTCLIGYAVEAMNRDTTIKTTIGIPATEPVYAVIALGYPDEPFQRMTGRKKPVLRWPAG